MRYQAGGVGWRNPLGFSFVLDHWFVMVGDFACHPSVWGSSYAVLTNLPSRSPMLLYQDDGTADCVASCFPMFFLLVPQPQLLCLIESDLCLPS